MMRRLLDDPVLRLRAVGLIEGTTLLLLMFVAMPLKQIAGWPTGVSVIGPVHGAVFLLYAYCLTVVASYEAWPRLDLARATLVCLIPLGPFLNDRWLRRRIRTGPVNL